MLKTISYFRNNSYFQAFASTRLWGAMNVFSGEDWEKNRNNFLSQNIGPEIRLFAANVEHKSRVLTVDGRRTHGPIDKVDALIACEKGICLGMPFGDCHPLILSGFTFERRPILALVHAGYNPLLQGVIANTVWAMKSAGTRIKKLRAFIGPGICAKCYEFGPEAPHMFRKYGEYVRQDMETGMCLVDLKGIILTQLISAGVEKGNISASRLCTYETPYLFSARQEKRRPRDPEKPVKTGMIFARITEKKA